MMLERHMKPRFRATRVVDALDEEGDSDGLIEQTKWFGSAWQAYVWIARGYLFRMRNRDLNFAKFDKGAGASDCPLCDERYRRVMAEYHGRPAWDGGPDYRPCRWHDLEWFQKAARRVARLLRHWDKVAGPFTRKRLEDALARVAAKRAA